MSEYVDYEQAINAHAHQFDEALRSSTGLPDEEIKALALSGRLRVVKHASGKWEHYYLDNERLFSVGPIRVDRIDGQTILARDIVREGEVT
ncbi:hypothetical protein [Ponticaulis profundi]|uniref:Uncharacterized protein n=1 Tax=Ponticaulis profundi TaxID=2665222 RepID=A0ABW1S8E9_9PROT